MEITFSKHASSKISLYNLHKSEINKKVEENHPAYFDIQEHTYIIITQITLEFGLQNAVIVTTKKQDQVQIVTVYPCSEIEKEIKKKLRQFRWIKIEKEEEKELV